MLAAVSCDVVEGSVHGVRVDDAATRGRATMTNPSIPPSLHPPSTAQSHHQYAPYQSPTWGLFSAHWLQ
jgi:hypothetical protein